MQQLDVILGWFNKSLQEHNAKNHKLDKIDWFIKINQSLIMATLPKDFDYSLVQQATTAAILDLNQHHDILKRTNSYLYAVKMCTMAPSLNSQMICIDKMLKLKKFVGII